MIKGYGRYKQKSFLCRKRRIRMFKRHFNYWLILLGLYVLPNPILGQGHFTITPECRNIYRLISELRFDQAQKAIHTLQKSDPGNLFPVHLENYIDFYTLIIYEDPDDLGRLEKNKKKRLEKLEQGDPGDPYYRLLKAELLLQWAIARLKFEDNFTAVRETQKAYRLLVENQKLFPDFALNNKGMAMVHAVIGTIPDNYRYLVEWLTGMEGDIGRSLEEMDELTRYCNLTGHLFRHESYVIYAFIELYINNNPEKAWKIIREAGLDSVNSPLARFVMATIAQRSGRTDQAIAILENHRKTIDQQSFLFLEFMLGINKLRKLDPMAKEHLLKYVRRFSGQNYIREAYQLLAWHSLVIESNKDLARYYYSECRQKGQSLLDEDKAAYREAVSGELPDPLFLKIRLLFDGAYYKRAHELLTTHKPELLHKNKLEYHYRTGRVYQELKDYSDALDAYQIVLSMENARTSYQQCNAALQSGIIYETLGDFQRARMHFEHCLSLKPEKYETSLHQKAEAGMERLKNAG
jgi:tetratricopeptide (TPR) repeat protein